MVEKALGSEIRGQHGVGMSRPLEWSFLLDQARWVPRLVTYLVTSDRRERVLHEEHLDLVNSTDVLWLASRIRPIFNHMERQSQDPHTNGFHKDQEIKHPFLYLALPSSLALTPRPSLLGRSSSEQVANRYGGVRSSEVGTWQDRGPQAPG